MPVIMPDIEPNNYLLPKEWLVPAYKTDTFKPRTYVDIYTVDEVALQSKIYELRSKNIQELSQLANSIADTISWTTLRPKYIEVLESLL
jgi:hypothetical protein